MLKRPLSPVNLPPPKRAHLSAPSIYTAESTSFESLYDELILHIFTYLTHADLCALQATNRDCARLSLDNQVHSEFIQGTHLCSHIEPPGSLVVVETPLPARVWKAPPPGFQGLCWP